MRHLSARQGESLKQRLEERAATLRAEISAALRQQDTPDTLHLANRLAETGDDALADLEISLDIASVERDMRELRQVVAALERIGKESFGVCEDCTAPIPFARLEVEPAALRCMPCQERFERGHALSGRSSL
jgi:RNA polymerase-binding protein DksA